MIKSHSIKLYPNNTQKDFFEKSCGTARFAYNWALNRWNEYYKQGIRTSGYSLRKEFNSIKKDLFPWTKEVGKCATDYSILNVEKSFKKFFKENKGHPKFKKKGKCSDSFIAVEGYQTFDQSNKKIWIPRLGWVKCAEDLRFHGKVNNVKVKRVADKWFAVVNIDVNEHPIAPKEDKVRIGVDFGLKDLAICSNGLVFKNNRTLHKRTKTLKRQQRNLSRKAKGSNNRKKQIIKLSKIHYKVSCARKWHLHNASRAIVNSADIIVLEDLNVKGMVKNHNLAKAISDASFGELRRQIEYKAKWEGKEVIIAARFFASSKTCSKCNHKKDRLKLSERVFKCESCGHTMDRDLNAAINLANYSPTGKTSGSKAFGEGSSSVEIQVSPSMN